MALLVLIVLGATLGWLASILARTEAPGMILRQIALGLVVSVVAGELANGGTMIGSLSFLGLGVALAATGVSLVLYHAIVRRKDLFRPQAPGATGHQPMAVQLRFPRCLAFLA